MNDKTATPSPREALDQCMKQFAFYAAEHAKAGKHEKAATNQRFADLCHAALSTPPARPGREPIPYSHAIGEAGQAYIKKVSLNGDAVLGGNFYYANLWEAMQEAALGALFDGAGA